ncbi:hypothetical protein ACIRSU_05570 [Streptomyces sp. NPDC101160]|uniref:hypothetical protein n=1 Tax=Streptomyces sp. NPDC101160 TaxID=3366118 RepID=UPI0037F24B4D
MGHRGNAEEPGRLQIHDIEETGPDGTRCVARCVAGVVRPGDRFDGGDLTVERLDRPLRPHLEFVDPPHAVRVWLTGPGVRSLRPRLVIATAGPRRYGYVGPRELWHAAADGPAGLAIATAADLRAWTAEQTAADLAEPFTYVVDRDGLLRLAPRRSEHVACAGRGEVLAAGEISWARDAAGDWSAVEVSNLSTGYAPDPECWPSVAAALDAAGLAHPGRLTHAVVFRRCAEPACAALNLVRDEEYACAVCAAPLPRDWNAAA